MLKKQVTQKKVRKRLRRLGKSVIFSVELIRIVIRDLRDETKVKKDETRRKTYFFVFA
jgi:DNA repair protein RadC